jgi:transposase
MLSFSGSLKVFLAVEPCDLRKSFNGLHALVTERLGEDPRTGALFVFTNRRRSRLKILLFDGTGLWVCTKRLEKGTFSWPPSSEAANTKLRLTPEALALLTDGWICAERRCARGMNGMHEYLENIDCFARCLSVTS